MAVGSSRQSSRVVKYVGNGVKIEIYPTEAQVPEKKHLQREW